jgi:ferredoxin
MCEFCAQHGEGKIWYLAAKNYGEELLSQEGRREHITAFFQDFEARVAQSLTTLDALQALPFVPDIVGGVATARAKKGHFGQVVPIEDVEKILDMTNTVVRLPCACRSLTTGRQDARFCYGIGIDPGEMIGQFPDYAEKLETLTPEEARTAINQLDQEGLIHSVWTFDTPFIGGVCNCDQDCIAYRLQISTGMMQQFFPAEYVAVIDWDRCSGCKLCRGQCPFGAIRYSASQDKCFIDPNLCYGCGICRSTCNREAITLLPRQRFFGWQRKAAPPGKHRVTVQACPSPRDCLACVDACPAGVFGVLPLEQRQNGVPASNWVVRPVFSSRCTGCQICVEACPEGAITVC